MSRFAETIVRAALVLAPALVVLVFAAWLLWPVPTGVMPLSADHTVHLTRIVLTAERFASTGSLSGWDPTWFFGVPLGDLYPQLGDLLIIAIHGLSLGTLDWPSAYALGFYVVFAIQGLVLVRVGRLFGLGPWPGLIAAMLMLADAGFTREGGWMYTVYFGVWPQALATSLASLGAGRVARFVALFTLVQWLLASNEAFWELRLDRLSEGFTHIQYQRFLIGAKPGLFLCAGLAVIAPAGWARRMWLARADVRHRWLAITGAIILTPVTAGLALWLVADTRATIAKYEGELGPGVVVTERVPGNPEFEGHYAEFLTWARAQWDARDHDYRIAIKGPRNSHLFMDAPIWTATPQYKLGFTPGDNFVHKPESGRAEVLDALGVRWIVGTDRGRARPGEVARFGPIYVRPHRSKSGEPSPLAWLEGPGEIELLEVDVRGGIVRARVSGIETGARVVFAIAGYPRWQLWVDGEPLEWFEQPVWGDGSPATIATRKHGDLRGGKARGDDGSEPTLIAAELPLRTGEVELELRYVERNGKEWLAEVVSLLAWIGVGLVLVTGIGPVGGRFGRALVKLETRLAAMLHPMLLAIAIPALLGLGLAHWQLAAEHERPQLLGWVEAGAAKLRNAEAGPVKTGMLIRPAVILRPRPGHPAVIELELDWMPHTLRGWVGLDDDQAQQSGAWAGHELRLEAKLRNPESEAEPWDTIARVSVPHEPGRTPIAVDTGAFAGRPVRLRIVDETRGKRVPRLGLNLDLEVGP